MGAGRINYSSDFYRGLKEAQINVGQAKFISSMYPRAKELSGVGKDLDDVEKGYVFGVANKLMDSKGRALEAAKMYSSIGVLDDKKIKKEVAKNLTKDLVKNPNSQYLNKVKEFMRENEMSSYARGISLESAIVRAGSKKREWILPLLLVLSGVFISGFNMTGNVIGVSNLNSFVGSGLFVFGLVLLLVYLKKDSPKRI
jgi:hypothetical protein